MSQITRCHILPDMLCIRCSLFSSFSVLFTSAAAFSTCEARFSACCLPPQQRRRSAEHLPPVFLPLLCPGGSICMLPCLSFAFCCGFAPCCACATISSNRFTTSGLSRLHPVQSESRSACRALNRGNRNITDTVFPFNTRPKINVIFPV